MRSDVCLYQSNKSNKEAVEIFSLHSFLLSRALSEVFSSLVRAMQVQLAQVLSSLVKLAVFFRKVRLRSELQ